MSFHSREDAGQQLAQLLRDEKVKADVVLGLPRGGVVVAAEAAHMLGLPLEVLVVRKIGHPWNREFAVGALAEDGTVVRDEPLEWTDSKALDRIIAEEQQRLTQYCARFHPGTSLPRKDKRILIVDDGLATGATTEAAVRCVRKQEAAHIIVAVPVASLSAFKRIQKVANHVLANIVDPDFVAVGQYYDHFPQTTDDEVVKLLQD
jgi:putative phosphoribosyl transferase